MFQSTTAHLYPTVQDCKLVRGMTPTMGLTGNWNSWWSETLDRARAQTNEENEPGSPCITQRRRCSSQKGLGNRLVQSPLEGRNPRAHIGIGLNKIMNSTVLIYRHLMLSNLMYNCFLRIYYNRPKKSISSYWVGYEEYFGSFWCLKAGWLVWRRYFYICRFSSCNRIL